MTETMLLVDADVDTLPPRDREAVQNPERLLWNGLMELAVQRINMVLEFARNWSAIRQTLDYELQRAKCVFHLEWIFDDDATDRFTFRELCRFSDSPDLQDVEPARQRIQQSFCREAAEDVMRPVPGKLRNHVVQMWLGNEIGAVLS